MRQHAGVFGSLLVVAAIVSGLALGVLALIDRAAAAGVRGELATHTGEDAALRLSLLLTTEETAADAAVRGLLVDAFQRDGAPIPVSVQHEVRTTLGVPVERLDTTVPEGEDATASIVAATIPDLASAATLVAGTWGDGADEATLQADAAAALGVAVGDRLELAGRELTLVGTWRVTDGLAARWVGDALTIRGTDGARLPSFGLLIVDDAVWPSLAEERRDVWTIVPGADLEAADLAPVVVAWEGIEAGVKALEVGRSFEKSGHFALTARELDRNVRALDAIGPASLLLVAMIALVTFIELGRLLTEVRTRELGLLWARGATPREVAVATAAETAFTALLGVGIGAGAAAALVALGDPNGFERLGASWWAIPTGVAVAAVLAVAVQSFLGTRRASRPDDPARAGRGQRIAGAGVAVLVVLGAVLATWQLRLYGSPVTPDAAGGSSVDAIAVSAPALVVVSLVLGALLLFPRIASLAERGVARRPQAGVLAARSVARRLALAATPIALVALAASQLIIAAGFAGSWERSQAQSHALRSGSELRVDAGPSGFGESQLTALSGVAGVSRLAAVASDTLDMGDADVRLLGVSAEAVGDLTLAGAGTIDPAALADGIRVDTLGTLLPSGGHALTLRLVPDQPLVLDDVAVWVQTDDGLLRRSAATADAGDSYTAPLPAAPSGAAWRIVAIDLTVPFMPDKDDEPDGIQVSLDAAEVDGTRVELVGWRGVEIAERVPLVAVGTSGAVVDPGTSARLLTPTGVAAARVVVSRVLAETMSAGIGSELSLPLRNVNLRVTISAIVDGIPGSDRSDAVLIDARALELELLRSEVQPAPAELAWIGAQDPATVGRAIVAALDGSVRAEVASHDPLGEMLATSSLVLWVTAIGSVVLALAALGAVVGAQLRSRRDETAVLRALGFSARQQGALRRRELLAVVGFGALAGLVAGALVVIVVIAVFVRAAVPGSYLGIPTEVALDIPLLGGALVCFAALVLAFVAGYGALVTRQGRIARVPEDAR